jgi:simple sugar transport system permease protein
LGIILLYSLDIAYCRFYRPPDWQLYNKTRAQEMIASLIVGFFANGVYQFILLFATGVIIPVRATHPMIKPDGVGVRMTVDMGELHYIPCRIY